MNAITEVPTCKIRRDAAKPGMIFRSSHGYRLLITEVNDNAPLRTDQRHVEIVGHLHADEKNGITRERYPASSMIEVEGRGIAVAPASITIYRPTAGLMAQALRRDADSLVRKSRLRAYSGPAYADHRRRLRTSAEKLRAQADAIEAQLRAS